MPGVGTIPRQRIKKNRNIARESHQNHKFLPNNAPVSKEMHKLKIPKLKDFP